MIVHLKRLATGAIILAIFLGVLWIGTNNEKLLNMVLFVASFCIISYIIGYFLLKIRIGKWRIKFDAVKRKYFLKAMKDKKANSNDSRRANYRNQKKSQKNKTDHIKS